MKIAFESQTLEINPFDGQYFVHADGQTASVQILRAENGRLDLLIDGQRVAAYVSSDGAKRWVTVNGRTSLLTKTSGIKRGARHDSSGGLTAPMPGQIRSVSVRAGDVVKQGQTLLTMEAMKMEIRIQAPSDGTVKAVFVSAGQTVEREQILAELE